MNIYNEDVKKNNRITEQPESKLPTMNKVVDNSGQQVAYFDASINAFVVSPSDTDWWED